MIGKRARHRSSKQASSAGMKLYYKGMLAVHLENGAVTSARACRSRSVREGFALLRLLAGGICNTDLELQRGYYGFAGTPGHEFVAEVVEADTRGARRQARGRAKSTSPARTATGAARDWDATARTAPCWESCNQPGRIPGVLHAAGAQSARPAGRRPDRARGVHGAAGRRLRDSGPGVDSAAARPVAVLGDGKLGLLIAHGAERPRLPGPPVRAARRKSCGSRAAAGVQTERRGSSRSRRTTGWWTRPAAPKACAPPRR